MAIDETERLKWNDANVEGFLKADEIRRKHNGIFVVNIFLGHDGVNAVEFRDYDKQLGKGESGRSVLEAVERAVADLHRNRFLETEKTARDIAIGEAVKAFNHESDVFQTADIQKHFRKDDGWMPTGDDVAEWLSRSPRVVRLSGGCHWFVLPLGLRLYYESPEKKGC